MPTTFLCSCRKFQSKRNRRIIFSSVIRFSEPVTKNFKREQKKYVLSEKRTGQLCNYGSATMQKYFI